MTDYGLSPPPVPGGTFSQQPTIVINNQPPKQPWLGKVFYRLILGLSLLANFVLIGMIGTYFQGIMKSERFLTGSTTARDKIAVIDINGPIFESSVKAPISELEVARRDDQVKAIILRMSSPGGDVLSTDKLYRAITKFQRQTNGDKPVVVFMDGLAASGAYWAAMPADRIMATENTVTGSIGVLMQTFILTGLLKEWGVQPIIFKTGEMKDAGSMFREMTEADQAELKKLMDAWYRQFLNVILAHRGEKVGGEEKLRKAADGRVFLAPEAKELGLVDELGYLDDAIKLAQDLAGITGEVRVVTYVRQTSFFELLSAERDVEGIISREKLIELQMPKVLAMPASWVGPGAAMGAAAP